MTAAGISRDSTRSADPSGIRMIMGFLAVFASAFCFYLSTVVVRWSQADANIDSAFFAFFRFLVGFAVVLVLMAATRQAPKPRNYHLLVGRCLGNTAAVYFFYQAVKFTSVAEANILNMTYPIFVAVLSWVLLRHQRDVITVAMVPVALTGVLLILAPGGDMGLNLYSLWGLASGLSAAVSIVYLNVSRQHHDVNTVLFYMFGLGTVVIFLLFHDRLFWPNRHELYYLALCGAAGIAGQFLLTIGFRYVTAVEGGVISSTRILLAAMLGPYLVAEHPLSWSGWMGAFLIFGANVILAVRKNRHRQA